MYVTHQEIEERLPISCAREYVPYYCQVCGKEVHGVGLPGQLCWDCFAVFRLCVLCYVEGMKDAYSRTQPTNVSAKNALDDERDRTVKDVVEKRNFDTGDSQTPRPHAKSRGYATASS